MRTLRLLACVVILVVTSPAQAAPTPEQLEESVARAKAWVYAQQNEQTWERRLTSRYTNSNDHTDGQFGGRTALAVYALLASGEKPTDPRLAPAIAWLETADVRGTYALAMRCQVWLALPASDKTRQLLQADADRLIKGLRKLGPAAGFWGYTTDGAGDTYSLSRGQYGVLGLWAASQGGATIDRRVWDLIARAWIDAQQKDGGWSYKRPGDGTNAENPVTGGMTAAAVATLLITADHTAEPGGACSGNVTPLPAIDSGIDWIIANLEREIPPAEGLTARWSPYATLYAIERVGLASGRRALGSVDWYGFGADFLLRTQQRDGEWNASGITGDRLTSGLPDTCFGLLFLARGGAPVAFNKLAHAPARGKEQWNQRPRDLANLVRWFGRTVEREYRWQTVRPDDDLRVLLESPLLFVSGGDDLNLSADQKSRLRDFVHRGGMIVGHADCSGRGFAQAFRRLASELFPEHAMRILPDSHPIFTQQQFPASAWQRKVLVEGVSNGVRELMLLFPAGDPGRAWHRNDQDRPEAWQFAANLIQYSVSGDQPLTFTRTPLIIAVGFATRTRRDSWHVLGADPEPGAWAQLDAAMRSLDSTGIISQRLDDGPIPEGVTLVHACVSEKLELDDAMRDRLRVFVESGGVLLVEPAGGIAASAAGAEALARALVDELSPMGSEHALLAGETPWSAEPRSAARRALGAAAETPLSVGSRGEGFVVVSRLDLQSGWVGHRVGGIVGLESGSSLDLMRRLVKNAAR
jgi:hypothetical protein